MANRNGSGTPAPTIATPSRRPGRSRRATFGAVVAEGPARRSRAVERVLNVRPDTPDFRDQMFIPTLIEVPVRVPLASYRELGVPVLDQGREGACTGFGLATVANYLLRRRRVDPDTVSVSPRMLYEMARRYDEWPGEAYDGSSARGAMKGWHKHGVCGEELWPHQAGASDPTLTDARAADAAHRPLGAYFRVNHRDLVAMHAALAEVGILYASAHVHEGWREPAADGAITQREEIIGGHAFAIVAYDEHGFWIQNSWGEDWGLEGFGHVTYDDWLENGADIWVARLAVPVVLRTTTATAISHASGGGQKSAYSFQELRPHVVTLANDGQLKLTGPHSNNEQEVQEYITSDFPRITASWQKKRLLVYAHGGLNGEEGAIQRIADYRTEMLPREVYPLGFIWRTDVESTLRNILSDAVRSRQPEAAQPFGWDFWDDRVDQLIEQFARVPGKLLWDEMKENAKLATTGRDGGARIAARHIAAIAAADPSVEIHLAGHSAGAILLGHLARYLSSDPPNGLGVRVASCTLWAPACHTDLFKLTFQPLVESGSIDRFAVFALTDRAEKRDDCAGIYKKSLLYLVSNAFEEKWPRPWEDGEPILGMEKFIEKDAELEAFFERPSVDLVLAPNAAPAGSPDASQSDSHGGFDNDQATLRATLARILGTRVVAPAPTELVFRNVAQRPEQIVLTRA